MDWPPPWMPSLHPWDAAIVAGLVALAAALAARALRRPLTFAAAGGIGALAGWWFTFGLLTASPRQLPERLPLLMLALVVFAPAAGALARRWRPLAPPLAVAGALATGWWMAGAPLVLPDLGRGWPALAGVAAATLALALAAAPRWAQPVAAAALLVGLWAAALPGPQPVLAAALLAAACGAAALRFGKGEAAAPALAALPLAAGMAALAAIPLLARGAPSDWAAAAAPLAALLAGAAGGLRRAPRRRGGGGLALAAALLGGGACATAAFLLR